MSPHASKGHPEIFWPELDSSYIDEFGPIEAVVYEIARRVWPAVTSTIQRTIRDLQAGQILMMKASALVSRKLNEDPERISNVHGYLYKTFIRLLNEEMEKESKHGEWNLSIVEQNTAIAGRSEKDLYRTILLHELLLRIDERTREVFELRRLGYTIEEIAGKRGVKSNLLRSEYSRKVRGAVSQIMIETEQAERRALLKRGERDRIED